MRNSLRAISACAVTGLLNCLNPALAQQIPNPTNMQMEIETETGARCRVFSGGPTLNVSGGNQPLTYFNSIKDDPQDFFGMVSLSIPLDLSVGKAKSLCYGMADIEIRKKKMDVYLELFERGIVTNEEVDALRQELFPSAKSSGLKPQSSARRPMAVVSYNQ